MGASSSTVEYRAWLFPRVDVRPVQVVAENGDLSRLLLLEEQGPGGEEVYVGKENEEALSVDHDIVRSQDAIG